MIPPLLLEELLKRAPKEIRDDIKDLYRATYKYGFSHGLREQRNKCQCNTYEDDDGTM